MLIKDSGSYPIIFLNSSSVRVLTPNSLALSNLEPGSSPTTTKSTFFETVEVVVAPNDSTRVRASSLPKVLRAPVKTNVLPASLPFSFALGSRNMG